MGHDFPPLCRYTYGEAVRRREERSHEASFKENVCCARAIERAIRDHLDETDEQLKEDCAGPVLEQYGFKRTMFVLASSIRRSGCPYLFSDDMHTWSRSIFVPQDGQYDRYFTVDTAAVLLEAFTDQVRQAYQALGLFGPAHCLGDGEDYEGKVLVLSPDALRESCWTPRSQLWYGEGGFGCSPRARGQAVYAICLGDGERSRWDRSDFTGVLDEQFLPDWAAEKLEALRSPQQEQGPAMGGVT